MKNIAFATSKKSIFDDLSIFYETAIFLCLLTMNIRLVNMKRPLYFSLLCYRSNTNKYGDYDREKTCLAFFSCRESKEDRNLRILRLIDRVGLEADKRDKPIVFVRRCP